MRIRQATGLIAWCLRRAGRWGVCLPPVGVYILPEHYYNRELIRHEGRHWLQAKRLGVIKFYFLYAWYHLRYGYDNNPLERDARA